MEEAKKFVMKDKSVVELTEKEIKEAIKRKWCPFCHDKDRKFFGTIPEAWQKFSTYEDSDTELDAMVAGEYDYVYCYGCDKEVPSEIWSEWF